jgi:hypothetical protein
MADAKKQTNSMTNSSFNEIIRPVSYTGPLMPRPVLSAENQLPEKQPTILVPDFSEYFQKFMDSIFQKTKEEPKLETINTTEKPATAEFSEKNKMQEFRMKYDPYNKLFYDQCILEGCDPETCYKKYFPEMS